MSYFYGEDCGNVFYLFMVLDPPFTRSSHALIKPSAMMSIKSFGVIFFFYLFAVIQALPVARSNAEQTIDTSIESQIDPDLMDAAIFATLNRRLRSEDSMVNSLCIYYIYIFF